MKKYIVVSERRGAASCPVEHTSLLAMAHEDDTFLVFVAIRAVAAKRVTITDLTEGRDDDPPF